MGLPRTVGVVIAVVAVTACSSAATPIDQAVPAVDLTWAGDPYYPGSGNPGYDVTRYDIAIDYRVDSEVMQGLTSVAARATKPLDRIPLDLGATVRRVWLDGAPATFEQKGTTLVVHPAPALVAGQDFTVRVSYRGRGTRMAGEGGGWITTDDGAVTAGEPKVATAWFPSNDHPSDKASYDVTVTTDEGLEVVGNGDLISHKTARDSTTWHWREMSPMATYLAFVAIGDFTLERSVSDDGIPSLIALSDELGAERRALARGLRLTPDIVDSLADYLGPYPFASTGGVAVDIPFSALETQTRPIYTSRVFGNIRSAWNRELLVVHELAHQWFGDSVTVRTWKDIWLNEGFATWSEWLYAEQEAGIDANRAFTRVYRWQKRYPRQTWTWDVPPGDPGRRYIFDWAVYQRGALAVQALRNIVGDDTFQQIVRTWLSTRVYGNGSDQEFLAHAEQVSGRSLQKWFDVWLMAPHRPAETKENGFPPQLLD